MRVIQDSEDEDGIEIDEAEPVAPEQHGQSNASPKPEPLKRNIEAVHRAHFQSDMAFNHQGNPSEGLLSNYVSAQDAIASSTSLPGHDTKRRKTPLAGSAQGDPQIYARDTGPITYENQNMAFHSSLPEQDGSKVQTMPAPDKPWALQETTHDEWQCHDHIALFSEVSSTVPNATATQQQLLAEVMAPAFLGLQADPDVSKYEPAKSSVPWSDYLKSSYKELEDQFQPVDQPPQVSQDGQQCSSFHSQSNRPVHENALDAADLTEISPLPPFGVINPEEQRLLDSPRKSKRKSSLVLSSDDELNVIDQAQEHYKPRPSRSRSLKLTGEDPIDYSMRPEKAAKRTRRTRTAGDIELTSTATTPEKVQQICDMGFTPSTTRRALRQTGGDVTRTVERLVADNLQDEDELAAPRSSKAKNTRKSNNSKPTQEVSTEAHDGKKVGSRPEHVVISHENSELGDPAPTMKSPAVKVVIPKPKDLIALSMFEQKQVTVSTSPKDKMEAPSTAGSGQKDTANDSEAPITEQSVAMSLPPKEKKRGRGRPRKEKEATKEPINDKLTETPTALAEVQLSDTVVSQPLAPPMPEPYGEETVVKASEHPSSATLSDTRPPANTSAAPEKAAKLVNTPATCSKSKTPYRVGLSKRARITPLLRTLKK